MAIRITGSSSGLDTDSMVQELVHAYRKKGESYTKTRTKTEWKQEAWATLNNKIKSFYSKYAGNMRFSDKYRKKSTTISDSGKASIVASDNAVAGTQTLQINKLAKAGYLTGGELDKGSVTGSTKLSSLIEGGISGEVEITINRGKQDASGNYDSEKALKVKVNSDTTINDFVKQIDAIGDMTASFDAANGRLFISSDATGEEANFSFDGGSGAGADILSALKLTGDEAVKIDGADAEIVLNGATFKSSSNTFSINGLTITAKGTTATGETLSLVTDTDYDAIYGNIKDFFKEYNSLMNEFDKLYNAENAKDYEPLSDEEKEAMSDGDIEKWEKKIKDSLLRYDSDLDTISSAMRNAMLSGIEINGTKYSLSSFGISTLGYFDAADNEHNAYHIDGDADDADTADKENKLKAMIASDPGVVESFFSQLANKLYTAMNDVQKTSNNYTSYGSFYSDKKLQSDYVEQTSQIDKWEKYVADIEEKYYKQFAAMESSLSSLQSQQSYISQLFA